LAIGAGDSAITNCLDAGLKLFSPSSIFIIRNSTEVWSGVVFENVIVFYTPLLNSFITFFSPVDGFGSSFGSLVGSFWMIVNYWKTDYYECCRANPTQRLLTIFTLWHSLKIW
jgi:hypothetical protein